MTTLTIRQLPDRTYEHVIDCITRTWTPISASWIDDGKLITKVRFISRKMHKEMTVFEVNGTRIKIDDVNFIPLPPKKYKFQVEVDGNEMIIKLPKRLKQRYSRFLLDELRIIMEKDEMIINFEIQNIDAMKRIVAMRTVRYPYNV